MRNIIEIVKDLSKEFPEYERTFQGRGGQDLTYIPWYHVKGILDQYAPGWSQSIVREGSRLSADPTEEQFYCIVRISIPYHHKEGQEFTSEASMEDYGHEYYKQMTKEGPKELSYGDVYSNAVSMALRRAAGGFGVGRYLYDKDKRQQNQTVQAPQTSWEQNAQAIGAKQGAKQPQAVVFPVNPGATSPDDMVTPRQLVAIKAIGNSAGLDAAEVCRNLLNIPLEQLSRRAGSALIDHLKAQAGQALRG